ncbi:MAG: tyrosine-type recombinase/integrase [Treponema sp.]|jgi:integrase|nr:tyrosine-type recombinase/integrase [Treponema sp.]
MGRPRAKDGVRARARSYDGYIEVHFEEYPGHWIASPERDREKALRWARRNRERLINRKTHDMAFYCRGFYEPESTWVVRMREKGRHFIDQYLRNRQAHLDNYFIPAFGDAAPADIRRRDIDSWLLTLKNPKERRLSGATKNKIIYSLRSVFEELIDLEIIERNPLDGIVPYDKTPVRPRGTIDRESLDKIYPATHGELVRVWGSSMWAAMMLVFNDTGSRPGEVRALTWRDIDIKKRFIPIRKGIESGTSEKVKETKTGVVKAGFLTARTVQELDIWRAESRWYEDGDYVFTANGAAPVSNEGINKAFRRGLVSAGIENKTWTPYWLRHSFGTYSLETLSEEEIAALMGNGVAVLRRHYLHPDDETLYRSARVIKEKLDRAREG